MNPLKTTLLALCVGGAVLAAPVTFADSYHYYDGGRYDRHYERHDARHHKGYGHKRHHRGHAPKHVIHHHVHHYEPVRERVVIHRSYPRRDYHQPREYRSATPMIMGGIVGGVLGNQVGKGRGRDVATVAGVLLGGSIGRDIGHR